MVSDQPAQEHNTAQPVDERWVIELIERLRFQQIGLLWHRFNVMLAVNAGLLLCFTLPFKQLPPVIPLAISLIGLIVATLWCFIHCSGMRSTRQWGADLHDIIDRTPSLRTNVTALSAKPRIPHARIDAVSAAFVVIISFTAGWAVLCITAGYNAVHLGRLFTVVAHDSIESDQAESRDKTLLTNIDDPIRANPSPVGLVNIPSDVQRQLELFEKRLDSDLRASQMHLEAVRDMTERNIGLFVILGAIGTVVYCVFFVRSLLRERDERKYQKEEQAQKLAFGTKMLDRSDEFLNRQLRAMGNIGRVIGLVQKTFTLQMKREKGYKQLVAKSQEVDKYVSDWKNKYDELCTTTLGFKRLSRRHWTQLTDTEHAPIERARMKYDLVPTHLIDRQMSKADSCSRLGQVCQLLGVSAYCDNDIQAAVRFLEKADEAFSRFSATTDEKYARAFCSHYRGLIAKHWPEENWTREQALQEARECFLSATTALKDDPGEFLTPLSLAEIRSYIVSERRLARQIVSEQIQRLETLKEASELSENQSALLSRAYLLLGNLEQMDGDARAATVSYQKVINHDPENPFGWLSAGYCASDSKERRTFFEKGLDVLEKSEHMRKREQPVRGTSLAWAALASHEIEEFDRMHNYLRELKSLAENVRSVAGRKPLVFSPISKNMETWPDLLNSVRAAVSAARATDDRA